MRRTRMTERSMPRGKVVEGEVTLEGGEGGGVGEGGGRWGVGA